MARLRLLLTGLAFWLAAFAANAIATDFTKPGPLAVGVQKFTIPDTSGKHPIPTMVWYPAAGPVPELTAGSPTAIMDASAATTGTYPLVVLIHGISGQGTMFGAVGRAPRVPWFRRRCC